MSLIEGTVERLLPTGIFRGWLRHTGDPAPAQIQIRVAGAVVGEAVARSFRPDLLRSGHGHGHYGFAARLRSPLPPGRTRAELFLPRHGNGIALMIEVPDVTTTGPLRVESLLSPQTAWTVDDVRGRPDCLDPAASRRAMGTARFVDVTFRFVLQRWPEKPEAQVFRAALEDGTLTPAGLLMELLNSRERADLGPALVSPWDPFYPYASSP